MAEHLVKTTSGVVRGYERDGRIDYLGIPYADPPVGPLRFKRSVPITPWDGVFDAKDTATHLFSTTTAGSWATRIA